MRLLKILLISLGLALTLVGTVQAAEPVVGKDYAIVNPPLPNDSPGKIEVTEFFWYGCIHCYHFEPTLDKWKKTMAKDVALRLIPAPFNQSWVPGAYMYYTLDAMGAEGKVRRDLFEAIHVQGKLNPNAPADFGPWAASKGLDQKQFEAVYKSFAVENKVTRARQITANSGIPGTPGVVVAGKYRINEPNAMPPEQFFEVLNALIDKARKEGLNK